MITEWNVYENVPDMVHRGYRIYVDGVEIEQVFAFNVHEGWVDARCLNGHECWDGVTTPPGTYYPVPDPGKPHMDPSDHESPCNVRYHGTVVVEGGEV